MDGETVAAATQHQPLLQQLRAQADQKTTSLRQTIRGVLRFAACSFLAAHFAVTTYRVRHAPRDLAFVVAASATLALLYCCISKFETLVGDDGERQTRDRLKMAVWALSTALTVMFSARVAPMMPPPLNLLVVLMALAVTVGGFCMLFLCDAAGQGCGSGSLETV